jgi:L-amino acid N-acyltransferase YncA
VKDNCVIRNYKKEDAGGMLSIFNHFAEHSYAVYCDFPLTTIQFEKLIEQIKIGLVIESDNKIIGFGYIGSYKPYPNFNRTGVLTYFILPEYTGQGLGTKLFDKLIEEGLNAGITNYLAHISSMNSQSLNFHKKQGFETAGLFKNVADKFGNPFDVVWVQKQFILKDD